jgi:ArsR family transcriptional regulator
MVQICKQLVKIPKSPKDALKSKTKLDSALNASFFKALSDATRLKILSCIAKCSRPCSVSEISECCEIDFSVVSRHLVVLARAGILDLSKEGRTVYYKVNYADVSKVFNELETAFSEYLKLKYTKSDGSCC